MKEIDVGIVGTRFMGKAHSNAYLQVPHFFDVPYRPVLRAACGRDLDHLQHFASQFGWETVETDWKRLVQRSDIDLIDISTSNATHMPIALAAAKNGKHIFCEKPIAMNADEARRMLDAAQDAGIIHMMAFNYRRVPAVALAQKMIREGKLGQIYHFNAVYYQDWLVDPNFSMTWRLDASEAGSGAHGDLNAHIVDLARYLVGEIEAVSGVQETFVRERPFSNGQGVGPVTVDDATSFLARFREGGLGSFQATRFANGRKNFLRLEVFGSKGSLIWNLERMNELGFFSLEDSPEVQGFRTILVTENKHPYISAWWPPGHVIGWEHTFTHEVKDLLDGIMAGTPVAPDFYDGWRCQQVLDAAVQSAESGRWVSIPE